MSLLAIDIGNTRVGFGVYTGGKSMDAAVRLSHADLDNEIAKTLNAAWEKVQAQTQEQQDDDSAVAIVSVVPDLTRRVADSVRKILDEEPKIIGWGANELKVPLKTNLPDERTVGLDRLAAAMAAYVNVERACAVVHVGTALVVDCVDDEGLFRGGAILPGLRMAAKALHAGAAQLPEVVLSAFEENMTFGTETLGAIRLGLIAGGRGAVRELVERYATALGAWPHVVATGGDAHMLLDGADGLVDSFVEDLVLQGVSLTWEHTREK